MALEIIFWAAAGLIVFAHLGYPLVLRGLVAVFGEDEPGGEPYGELPTVSLIVAAYDEEEVIERKVANARALDYPPSRLEVIVASDGSSDRTADLARSAGADLVLELRRGGKVAALNQAARRASGAILAFSDANSFWRPGALRRLVARFSDERVGYACGQVRFLGGEGGRTRSALS
jgi:cellulose synthase/poly-beta-1,6-N-acetylglucosamine synthase-like glycosyltransferase